MNEKSKTPNIDPELEARIVALVLGEASDFEREELDRLIASRPELADFQFEMQRVHGLLNTVGSGKFEAPQEDWKLPADKRNAVLAVIRGEATIQQAVTAENSSAVQPMTAKRAWQWNPAHVAVAFCIAGFMGLLILPPVYNTRGRSDDFAEATKAALPDSGIQFTGGADVVFSVEPRLNVDASDGAVRFRLDHGEDSQVALSTIQNTLEGSAFVPLGDQNLWGANERFSGGTALNLRGAVDVQQLEELDKEGTSKRRSLARPQVKDEAKTDAYLSNDMRVATGEAPFSISEVEGLAEPTTATSTGMTLALDMPQLIAQNNHEWSRNGVQDQRRDYRYEPEAQLNSLFEQTNPKNSDGADSLERLSELEAPTSGDAGGSRSAVQLQSSGNLFGERGIEAALSDFDPFPQQNAPATTPKALQVPDGGTAIPGPIQLRTVPINRMFRQPTEQPQSLGEKLMKLNGGLEKDEAAKEDAGHSPFGNLLSQKTDVDFDFNIQDTDKPLSFSKNVQSQKNSTSPPSVRYKKQSPKDIQVPVDGTVGRGGMILQPLPESQSSNSPGVLDANQPVDRLEQTSPRTRLELQIDLLNSDVAWMQSYDVDDKEKADGEVADKGSQQWFGRNALGLNRPSDAKGAVTEEIYLDLAFPADAKAVLPFGIKGEDRRGEDTNPNVNDKATPDHRRPERVLIETEGLVEHEAELRTEINRFQSTLEIGGRTDSLSLELIKQAEVDQKWSRPATANPAIPQKATSTAEARYRALLRKESLLTEELGAGHPKLQQLRRNIEQTREYYEKLPEKEVNKSLSDDFVLLEKQNLQEQIAAIADINGRKSDSAVDKFNNFAEGFAPPVVDYGVSDTKPSTDLGNSNIEDISSDENEDQIRNNIAANPVLVPAGLGVTNLPFEDVNQIRIKQESADLTNQFNGLMKQKRYSEAELVAKKKLDLNSKLPEAIIMVEKAKLQRQIAAIAKIKARKSGSALTQFNLIEEFSALPIVDYGLPNAKSWTELPSRRADSRTRTESELRIEKSLSEQTTLHFEDVPLTEVIRHIATAHNFNIFLDTTSLESEGLDVNQHISIEVDGITLRSAMNLVLQQAGGLVFDIEGEVLKVIKRDAATTAGKDSSMLQQQPLKRIIAPAGLKEFTAKEDAFSTFSLHVSDVSFKLAMASLGRGEWPEAAKVRIEEFVNAFDYGDPMPRTGEKVACQIEQAIHPFLQQRNMLRISMKTAAAGRASTTPLRLTFLLDNSGSMERSDRRQTIRKAFSLLAEQLNPTDHVTLISFARQPRLLADSVKGDEAQKLVEVIANLPSEGGTNIEAALQLAFEKAKEHQDPDAQNRIILLTDGAVNLGNANPDGLSQIVTQMRNSGIAFDAAGISADGLNDEVLEALTRKGDGRYYLLDSLESADDGFAKQIAGALRPSAKNVKVQIEFNPNRVGRYKLLGFEKHILKKEDFRNDKVDAAEMAAAEAGVAMYQFEAMPDGEGDIGSVSVRFQDLSTGQMVESRWPIPYQANAPRINQAAPSLQIATSAALLAAKLRGEPLGGSVDLKTLSQLISALPELNREESRVQQLRTMIEQARQLGGQ